MKLSKILLFSLLFSPACSPSPSQDQTALAFVGEEKITVADLKKVFSEQAGDYGPDLLADREGSLAVKKKLLTGLVEERLLLQVAREKGIQLTGEEEQEIRRHFESGYHAGTLERLLKERAITLDDWLERQKNKKVIDKLIEQEVYRSIQVTPEEIAEYYQKNRSQFQEPEQVHCRQIVTAKQEKAMTIFSLLEKGENFAGVAKQYSESPDRENGGDLGFFGRGEYPLIFEKTCFNLRVGQTSRPIPSEYGFHIFRVVEKKPSRQILLKEASVKIKERLREEKGENLLGPWLEGLHHRREIVVYEKGLREIKK